MAGADILTLTTTGERPVVVTAQGDVDTHTSDEFDAALAALAPDADVVVDLSGVEFVDSSGLRVLVGAHKRQRAGGGNLTVRSPSGAVRRLLEITGLTAELQVE